ncbi:MAG: hypothetical protein H6Q70_1027 [Firmicutes bacterium]|jgi:beta-galactosidase beta subunit|nr:hypothetical protein [Bacillota bacterium]
MNAEKNKTHPEYKMPDDPHAEYRYKAAMRHVELAKAAGKSSEEIHQMFQKIMDFDVNDSENLPTECHKKYYEAVQAAKQAIADGKTSKEAHEIFYQMMEKKA